MSKELEAFFCLLRSGVWGDKTELVDATVSWAEVYDMARKQSVVGVTFDAVMTQPKERQPMSNLKYEWWGNVYIVELNNKQVNTDVASLVFYLNQCGIESRLMKGQGCASFYPVSHHRQCGDIDIFVGEEQYERAKDLIRCKGIEIDKEGIYDAHFTWGNTLVEMHKWETFFYCSTLNKRLQSICRKEEWLDGVFTTIFDQRVVMFNPTFNAFYIFVHFYHHFLQVGVGLRQICDWMLLLKQKEDNIEWDRLYGYVKEIDAVRAWKAFYGLATEYLGLRLSWVPKWMADYELKDVSFVLGDVLNVGNFGKYGESMQKRSFGRGLKANVASFMALIKRLMRVSRFGYKEAFAYPLWRVFCDRGLVNRYRLKNNIYV